MALRLHDTLADKVEMLVPGEPGHVKLYVCGPTVYDHAHVGHMRTNLTYDLLVRHMRSRGLRVTYVRNVTDIDDKIVKRAAERGEEPMALANRFEQSFHDDVRRLGLLDPEVEPRVSEHMPEIHAMIAALIDKGAAYPSAGDVYFKIEAFPAYGKLSHRKQSDLEYGASGRLDEEERKRKHHPADFALWKGCSASEPGWDSPWGRGRPGWHIECSAMSMRYLGESFDVHGGGLDLIFPHHENEIAQSETVTGKQLSKLWMHGGFIETSKEKMSKSLGNFLTARDAFAFAEPEALRYMTMTVHYRAPLALDWTRDETGAVKECAQLDDAERRVEYLYRTRTRLAALGPERLADGGEVPEAIAQLSDRLGAALDDDLNAPIALAVTADFLKHVNDLAERAKGKTKVSRAAHDAALAGFETLAKVLGLGEGDPGALLARVRARRAARLSIREADVEAKIEARVNARKAKDFARADAIRDEIAALGIELMDGPEGTSWRIP
jgi:cysteinyl-tRNA synthetase